MQTYQRTVNLWLGIKHSGRNFKVILHLGIRLEDNRENTIILSNNDIGSTFCIMRPTSLQYTPWLVRNYDFLTLQLVGATIRWATSHCIVTVAD